MLEQKQKCSANCKQLILYSVLFDSFAPAHLALRANLRLLFLAPAPMLDCGQIILLILRRGSAFRETTGGRCSVSAHFCGEAAIIRDAAFLLRFGTTRRSSLQLERSARPRDSAIVCLGRCAAGVRLGRQRRHCIQQKRRCAAEVCGAKYLACPTLGLGRGCGGVRA